MHRRLGRADARTLPLLAHVLALDRQADDMKRQPPRRRIGLRALIDETALDQRIRHQPLQILSRTTLHPGRDFFGEEFKEEIGHGDARLITPLPLVGRGRGWGCQRPTLGGWRSCCTGCKELRGSCRVRHRSATGLRGSRNEGPDSPCESSQAVRGASDSQRRLRGRAAIRRPR